MTTVPQKNLRLSQAFDPRADCGTWCMALGDNKGNMSTDQKMVRKRIRLKAGVVLEWGSRGVYVLEMSPFL